MTEIERVGAEAFEGTRLRRPGTVAVAFSADWCPFCRAFAPVFADLTRPRSSSLLVADLTSLDSPLWERFSVEIVPTVVVFKDGAPVFRADGVSGVGLVAADVRTIEGALR